MLLAAGRLCVVFMAIYAVTIGGLLAAIEGGFNPILFLAILIGFVLAHVADNLLNDLTDYIKGIDVPGYFRTLYGPHPVIDGIVPPRSVAIFISAVVAYGIALALYLGFTVHPAIPLLAFTGVASMALYAGYPLDATKLGLGEPIVAIVWGPVMAGGTLLALSGSHPVTAVLVYLPFAVTVSLVLIGKHLDKYDDEYRKGVGTLPVRLGKERTRRIAAAIALIAPLAAALGLLVHTGSYLAAALTLTAIPSSILSASLLSKPRPGEPPRNWRAWPLWYAAWGFRTMEATGRATILGLLAALLATTPAKALILAAAGLLSVLARY